MRIFGDGVPSLVVHWEQRLWYVNFCCNEDQGAGMFNLVRNSRVSPVPDKCQQVRLRAWDLSTLGNLDGLSHQSIPTAKSAGSQKKKIV
jgi:hypothetical protein